MKKLVYLALLAIVAVSCSKDESMPFVGNYKITGYSAVETKTQFGTPNTTSTTSGTIPFEWSAGDKIWSNGQQSGAAEIDDNNGKAVFSFANAPGTDVYYNMTGSSNQVNVPAAQSIANNLGANGDFGYATVSNGSFTLEHATAYLWFDVTSSIANATLEWVKVDAGDVDIAGKATWNGSAFVSVTEGSKSVTLAVGQTLAATNSNVWAMVVMPANLTGKEVKVTYKLTVGGADKYYKQTLTGKALTAGKTQKITTVITESALTDYMELRVLTFEDVDFGSPYYINVWEMNWMSFELECTGERQITSWSDFIPTDGTFYGNGHNLYSWKDIGNTELQYLCSGDREVEDNGFWGIAGHAGVSCYVTEDYENYGNYMYDLLAYNVTGGANGSRNFCTHYGYKDPEEYNTGYGPTGDLPGFGFSDGVARVIDHMYVTHTAYGYNVLVNGETDFGGTYVLDDDALFKIVAYGYETEDDTDPTTAEFYLLAPGQIFAEGWCKWDLSVLGKVVRVEFNLIAGRTGYGEYGNMIPAYFAYDDVAVRF